MAGGDLRRFAWIAGVALRHAALYLLERTLARSPRLARTAALLSGGRLAPGRLLPGPERLRVAIEELGGMFIKFGQMLALQPDILPLAYCNALFNLLDRVPPFPYAEVERIFSEELGAPPAAFFERFEERPIATASIGQVHVAWRGGRKLAVKVQRPAVDREFGGDIRMMRSAVAWIRRLRLRPLYWVIAPMSEFVSWTREELDYRNEARYMEQLRANARDNDWEQVPELVADCTTRRILTVEFLAGVTVLDYLRALESGEQLLPRRLAAQGFDPAAFARHMIDNFLGDAFRHGLFHSDLHPANLMILPGNVVGYIDFGITGVLSRYSRENLVTLTLTYTKADLDGMANAFLKVSARGAHFDLEGFHQGLRDFGEEWYEGRERRLRKNFTLMMLDMLRLSHATDVWPERDVIKYIRSSIAIDGLITRFAPSFDVGGYLSQVCASYLLAEARGRLLSYENLFAWSAAGGRLAADGPLRAAAFLARAAAGDLPARADPVPPDPEQPEASRAVRSAGVLFAFSLLLAASGAPPRWGANLFTAEALALLAALAALATDLKALARARRT